MNSAFATELSLFRRAHVGAARRARRAWGLVEELRSCTVVLPYTKTLHFLSAAIYFNAGYDACERYSSVEEFEESFEEDLKKTYPERLSVDGVDCIVMRPFFSPEYDFLTHLHMSYLHGCDPKELVALDAKVPELTTEVPTGLSDEEATALIAYHRAATIKLVNRLRHLRTATDYLTTGLRDAAENKHKSYPEHTMDPRAAGLVEKLVDVSTLPFLPAPCRHFGTDADRINTLHTLEADEATLAPLLAEA